MNALLFLDDWMVEQSVCLERVWHRPRPVGEIFSDYYPNSVGYGGWINVFYDARLGRYVMYLRVMMTGDEPEFLIRLLSDDPAHWPNPTYDLTSKPAWHGFKDVVRTQNGGVFKPWVDSLAATPAAERGYIALSYNPDRQVANSILGFSDDGLHFDIDWAHPWHNTRSDTWNGMVWNPETEAFQIFTRPVLVDRRVAIVTTQDFRHYTRPLTVLQPDANDRTGTEFYSMPTRRYEDLYIGMVHVMSTDLFEPKRVKMAGRVETQLTYSYNGVNWYRPHRQPFLPTEAYGEVGGGQVYGAHMLTTNDHRLLIYADTSPGEHAAYTDMQKAGMDTTGYFAPLLYELRLDGFCSLKTWGKDGRLQTKTVIPQSGALRLNLRTTRHTSVRVQMVDGETGEPVPGYTFAEAVPISGDHLFAEPRWQERQDIAGLVGKPVRIDLMLREAELFAIRLDAHVLIGREPRATL